MGAVTGEKKKLFVERRPQGDYAVRRPGSERATAVEPTEYKAIERAKKLDPHALVKVRGYTRVAVPEEKKIEKSPPLVDALRKHAGRVASTSELLLKGAVNGDGRYDGALLAELVEWNKAELARYLGVDRSVLSSNPASREQQAKLGVLADVVRRAVKLVGDLPHARAWLNATPIRALEKKTPKDVILEGRIDVVDSLLEQIEGGVTL